MDSFDGAYDKALSRGARAAVEDVLGLKKGERVLIVTNPPKDAREISMALFDAALEEDAKPVMMVQRTKGPFDPAEEEVLKALASNPDVFISISEERFGKDQWGLKHGYKGKRRYDHIFDYLYEEKKARAFWSPGVTKDIWSRSVAIDYSQLRDDAARLSRIINAADAVHVTAPGGTDIVIGVRGRKCRKDDGDCSKPGMAGNLPAGEVFVSPALGTADGVIAFDGSIVLTKGEVIIKTPIRTIVKQGFITEINGGAEAVKLEGSVRLGEKKAKDAGRAGEMDSKTAAKYARNAWSIGELGIGLNRKAKIVAVMLEDEKVFGTCHFAVGSNYDGDSDALIHLDGLVRKPTITAVAKSGRTTAVMEKGVLAWD